MKKIDQEALAQYLETYKEDEAEAAPIEEWELLDDGWDYEA